MATQNLDPVWTAQQAEAIDKVHAWLKAGYPPIFTLYGYAGTGKTTILKHLAANCSARVAAYTGKAALVLRKKGCDASTIHSMIYRPRNENPQLRAEYEELRFKLQHTKTLTMEENARLLELQKELAKLEFELNEGAFTRAWDGSRIEPPRLIAIDEASMVNEQIGEDLLLFGIPLLLVMDPAQLPPISGEGFFYTDTPDVMLDEIHRQAWNSPIIRMATAVRNGATNLRNGYGFEAQVRRIVPPDWYVDPELQLICGRHVTRFKYNADARSGLGFENELPVIGDKLCCWRNDRFLRILNGSFWRVLDVDHRGAYNLYIDLKLRSDDGDMEDGIAREIECTAHKRLFLEAKPPEDWDQRDRNKAHEFNYGYALTCHKAQGSEWGKVILIDESWCWGDPALRWQGGQRCNWLYTGITRASDRLIVIKT